MPADSLCPQFVAAVVKCTASRGPDREGVSIHLTEGDIKGLVKNLPLVQEANSYMVKAREIEKQMGGAKEVMTARHSMECDMVEFVTGKMSKINKAQTSLEDISRILC